MVQSSKNKKTGYFAIGTNPKRGLNETRQTRKSIARLATRHFQEHQENVVIGKFGSSRVSVIGKAVEKPNGLKKLLIAGNIKSEADLEELTVEIYYAHCKEGHGRLNDTRTRDKGEAEAAALQHYRDTGGPDGGHETYVETVVRHS
jgi:hypothetical protein